MDGFLERLHAIREKLPVNLQKWLKVVVALDLEAGRALAAYLGRGGVAAASADYGGQELYKWVGSVRRVFHEDAPEYAHLFQEEKVLELPDVKSRRAYLDERLADLEKVWKDL